MARQIFMNALARKNPPGQFALGTGTSIACQDLMRETGAYFPEAMDQTPRASSIIENLNSRLRSHFFLRRQLGEGYLDLLRFFLNHRKFQRSENPERVGKSPAELLTGRPHPHWLELLGFRRFHQN